MKSWIFFDCHPLDISLLMLIMFLFVCFSLGIHHDGYKNNCTDGINIMSSIKVSGPESFKWSQCSAEALRTSFKYCLCLQCF